MQLNTKRHQKRRCCFLFHKLQVEPAEKSTEASVFLHRHRYDATPHSSPDIAVRGVLTGSFAPSPAGRRHNNTHTAGACSDRFPESESELRDEARFSSVHIIRLILKVVIQRIDICSRQYRRIQTPLLTERDPRGCVGRVPAQSRGMRLGRSCRSLSSLCVHFPGA